MITAGILADTHSTSGDTQCAAANPGTFQGTGTYGATGTYAILKIDQNGLDAGIHSLSNNV